MDDQNGRQLSFGETNQGINFDIPKDSEDWLIKKEVAGLMNKIKSASMDSRLQSTSITYLEICSMLAVKACFV